MSTVSRAKEAVNWLEGGAATVPDVIFYIAVLGVFILKGGRAT